MLFGKHINRYYLKHLPALIFGILSLLVVDLMQLKIPELYKLVVNGLNDGFVIQNGVRVPFDTAFLLDEICRPMLIVILFLVLGRFLWRICFFGSAIRVEEDLRGRMFDRCKDLSQQYYQVNKVGNLMSLFTNDLETVQDCFGSGILMLFDAALLGVLAIGKMADMHPVLTLLCLLPMGLLLCASLIVGRFMTLKWQQRQGAFSELSDFSQESFAGIAVIKAFVKESLELMAFRKINRHNEDANVAYTRLSVLLNITVTLLVESVICVILGYGGYLVYIGRFNAGQLVEFIGYFNAIIWPVMAVSQLIEIRSRGKASLERIGELLDAEPDVKDSEDVTDPDIIRGDIRFQNLTFRYPDGGPDVLRDVSFSISAGENVGIVGRTGAGKTTLVDLILRTYNVPDGTVFLDGKDVNSLPISAVRRNCAYVPQDNFLFSDTIERNITFGDERFSHGDVENAARLSDVHSNIMDFPMGYGTVLGERGVTVSGGQKQRISIARALAKNAPILILDDSVSAVDVKTEKTILQNLKDLRQGKTTILIAHRISTIEKMDKLLYFDDSRLIAVGTHSQLYDTCPSYRSMVDLQKLDDPDTKED